MRAVIHIGLAASARLGLVVSLRGLGNQVCWRLPGWVRPLGRPMLAVAGLLWLAAFRKLGGATVANGNFFGRGRRSAAGNGIFRLLRNPMYDSYALALVGLGLRQANAV